MISLKSLFDDLPTDMAHGRGGFEPLAHDDHVHVGPNFGSLPSYIQAVAKAYSDKLACVGISNYYDPQFYPQFAELALKMGIFPGVGLELITQFGSEGSDICYNDKNTGRCYVVGLATAGIMKPTGHARSVLGFARNKDSARLRAMIELVNQAMAMRGVAVYLDEAEIIRNLSLRYRCDRSAIVLQERHLAEQLQQALYVLGCGDLSAIIEKAVGKEVDKADPGAVQNALRSELLRTGKPCYIQETFPGFKDGIQAIREMGGIPCYPILGDDACPTEFESDPSKLAANLIRHGIYMVQFIPRRNSLATVERYMAAMDKVGILATVGTEHNTPDYFSMIPACSDGMLTPDLQQYFWEGACVAAAHQVLVLRGETGFLDSKGERVDPDRLIKIGDSLIRQVYASRPR